MNTENERGTTARPSASKDGMTLLEVLIASTLSVLLIAGIYAALQNADRGTCLASQYVAAYGRARELLESMRGAPYTTVTTNNYPYQTNLVLTDVVGSMLVQIPCTRTNTITPAVPAIPDGKDITVTVTWTFRGKTMSNSAYTTIYNKPQ
jgi:prepilin-type N-terminal cleavage/methylation domain-containing protein